MGGLPISTLMIGTLVVAFVIGAILWLRHMRTPENRHPMDGVRERNVARDLDEEHGEEEGSLPTS